MIRRFFLREGNMLAAIIVNSLIIFALYFPELQDVRWLINLDHFFIAVFLVEAIVKIYTYGWKGYWSSRWN
ncbi:MAG: ion transporter, partial [Bacteroidota bacterium]